MPQKGFLAGLPGWLPAEKLLRLSTFLALAGVVYLVWHLLGMWGTQGLDFSVYWHGGQILNEAGQSPSDLYGRSVAWAGGPELPFTYPPFAALLFSLLARLPQHSSLLVAEDHRCGPRRRKPQYPDAGPVDYGLQCRRVLCPGHHGVLASGPAPRFPDAGDRGPAGR